MTDTSDATPRPDDMPEMVPNALERIEPQLNYDGTVWKSRVVDLVEQAFRDGILAERARSLNAQIKTALADGERDGRQLAEDCRITPEAANTPCYVPPNSVSLTERSRTPEPSASVLTRASDVAVSIYVNRDSDHHKFLASRIAGAIISTETAVLEEAVKIVEKEHTLIPCPDHYSAEVAKVSARRIVERLRTRIKQLS